MSKEKYLIVVGGPTASGKTSVAIALAQHFGTEILSADSRQFFREMSIGTAKPTPKELAQVKHHFIDSVSIHEQYSVGDYERDALALLAELYEDHDLIVLTGGSGLYIRALCEGLDAFPEIPAKIREELVERFEHEGLEYVQNKLQKLDPEYFATVDRQNPQRLIRALEVCIASGRAYSSFRSGQRAKRPFTPVYLKLEWDREILYERINHRVDQMIEEGLLDEVKKVYSFRDLNALQTVGYKELFDYLDVKSTLPEAVELIKRNSRRYAKRQMTWLRKREHWQSFEATNLSEMIQYIYESIQHKSD
jgi:tRNA dimethylallyltransferase